MFCNYIWSNCVVLWNPFPSCAATYESMFPSLACGVVFLAEFWLFWSWKGGSSLGFKGGKAQSGLSTKPGQKTVSASHSNVPKKVWEVMQCVEIKMHHTTNSPKHVIPYYEDLCWQADRIWEPGIYMCMVVCSFFVSGPRIRIVSNTLQGSQKRMVPIYHSARWIGVATWNSGQGLLPVVAWRFCCVCDCNPPRLSAGRDRLEDSPWDGAMINIPQLSWGCISSCRASPQINNPGG